MLIAHTADWEIGPAGDKLDPETGLNAAMMDRYRCARFVIEDSIRHGAQLILHGGDIWRGAGESAFGCRPTPTQVYLFREAVKPAREAGIPVLGVMGNHDSARSIIEKSATDLIGGLDGVTFVEWPCLMNIFEHDGIIGALMPASDEPIMGDMPEALQVACFPYPSKNLLLRDQENRNLSPADLNLLAREKVMDCLRGLVGQRIEGVPCILLIHCAFDMAAAGKQNGLAMLTSEWTLNAHEVAALGFDAVCAGHYHRAQLLHEEPWIAYSGSPEATSFGEETEAKSYFLLDVGPEGLRTVETIPTPYRQLVTLTEADFIDPASLVAGVIPVGAIVRFDIPASSTLTIDEAKRAIEAAGAFEVRVTKARAESVRRRETAVTSEMNSTDALREWLAQKPDLHPLTDALIVEALRVEEAMGGVG